MNWNVKHWKFLPLLVFGAIVSLYSMVGHAQAFLTESSLKVKMPIRGKVCTPVYEVNIKGWGSGPKNESAVTNLMYSRKTVIRFDYDATGYNPFVVVPSATSNGKIRLSRDLALIAKTCTHSHIDILAKSLGAVVAKYGMEAFYEQNPNLFDKARNKIHLFFKNGAIGWEHLQENPRLGAYSSFPIRFGETIHGRYGLSPMKPIFSGLDLIVSFYSLGDNLLDILPNAIGNTTVNGDFIPTNIAHFRTDTDEHELNHTQSISASWDRMRDLLQRRREILTKMGAFDFERFQKWIHHPDEPFVKAAIKKVFWVHSSYTAARISIAIREVFFSTWYSRELRTLAFSKMYDVSSNHWKYASILFHRIKRISKDASIKVEERMFYAGFVVDLLGYADTEALKAEMDSFLNAMGLSERVAEEVIPAPDETNHDLEDPDDILDRLRSKVTHFKLPFKAAALEKLMHANLEKVSQKEQIMDQLKKLMSHEHHLLGLWSGYVLANRVENIEWLLRQSWNEKHETRMVARRALYDIVPPFVLDIFTRNEKKDAIRRLTHANRMQHRRVNKDKWYEFDQFVVNGEDLASDFDDFYFVPHEDSSPEKPLLAAYSESQADRLKGGARLVKPSMLLAPRFDPLQGRFEFVGWVSLKQQKYVLIGHFDAEGDGDGVMIGSIYESPNNEVFRLTPQNDPLKIRYFKDRLVWLGRFELD